MSKVLGRDQACPIARTLEVVGERWSLLVVREAAFGSTRFSQFREALGISPEILSARLAHLVETGVFERRAYRMDQAREREEYRLTPAGRDLLPVLAALGEWGLAHRASRPGAETRFRDRISGEPVVVRFTTSDGRVVEPERVTLLGPAAR